MRLTGTCRPPQWQSEGQSSQFAICTSPILHLVNPPKLWITFVFLSSGYYSHAKRDKRQFLLPFSSGRWGGGGQKKVYYGKCAIIISECTFNYLISVWSQINLPPAVIQSVTIGSKCSLYSSRSREELIKTFLNKNESVFFPLSVARLQSHLDDG